MSLEIKCEEEGHILSEMKTYTKLIATKNESEWNQSNSTRGKSFALHAANPHLIPGMSYDSSNIFRSIT